MNDREIETRTRSADCNRIPNADRERVLVRRGRAANDRKLVGVKVHRHAIDLSRYEAGPDVHCGLLDSNVWSPKVECCRGGQG